MTNYESVEPDKVKDIFAEAFAVNKETGEVLKCFKLPCRLCLFRGNGCGDARRKWLDQPAFDPEKDIDWAKVPVDTPVLVWNSEREAKRYFCQKINRKCFETFVNGSTSWSSFSNDIFMRKEHWPHCKLYRPEDIEKYRKKEAEKAE